MSKKVSIRQSFSLFGEAISCLFKNPQIFYPFAILAFVQLLLMQILFFAPRFPLVLFFGPIITRLKGAIYMQYPLNFDLMNHWFQSAQVFIFLFASSYFIGMAVLMVARVNRGEPLEDRLPAISLKKYVNAVFAFLLIFLVMLGLTSIYGLVIRRAIEIRSTAGIYFLIKQAVLIGAPYFNLLFSIFVTSLFAYLLPVIVLEGKNIVTAVGRAFQLLAVSFWPILIVITLSSVLYFPILLARSNYHFFSTFLDPEGWQIFVIFGVFVMLFIDAVQYTAVTLCYFLTKDE